MKTKGIILAGGFGSRLYPVTNVYSKQLIAVYDKPLIYYPLSTLISLGINEILIISDKYTFPLYQKLFNNIELLGINIEYAIQNKPNGIAEALIIGEKFIGKDNICLILGDNIFYGNLPNFNKNNTIFGLYVKEPQRYGVIMFNNNNPTKIIEKPQKYISNYAVPGIYYYNSDVINIAKTLKPSARGELEITDINNILLQKNELNVIMLNVGMTWLDCGTPKSLLDASNFISSIEERHGIKIGCYEEVAFNKGLIDQEQMLKYIETLPFCDYRNYLSNIFSKELSSQLF